MNKEIKIVALFGESGAGKNRVQNAIFNTYPEFFHQIISCTTRPPRQGDKEGKDYYFMSEMEFLEHIFRDDFIEATSFNNWFYGTLLDALHPNKINVGVFTPSGIEALMESSYYYNLKILPIYIYADAKTRLIRSLQREDNPDIEEIIRRYGTDKEDFADINFKFMTIENGSSKMNFADCARTIYNYCEVFFM